MVDGWPSTRVTELRWGEEMSHKNTDRSKLFDSSFSLVLELCSSSCFLCKWMDAGWVRRIQRGWGWRVAWLSRWWCHVVSAAIKRNWKLISFQICILIVLLVWCGGSVSSRGSVYGKWYIDLLPSWFVPSRTGQTVRLLSHQPIFCVPFVFRMTTKKHN